MIPERSYHHRGRYPDHHGWRAVTITSRNHPQHRKGESGPEEEKSGWEEEPSLLSFKFLPRSQDEPRGGKHQDQVHCNDEVYDSKFRPREKNGRLVIEQRQGEG